MSKPDPRSFDAVFVNKIVGVQSSANRFGRPGAEKEITQHLAEPLSTNEDVDDFSVVDDDDDSEEDDTLMGTLPSGGNGAPLALGEHDLSDDSGPESAASGSPPSDIPHFARTRINLAALSQVFNLYFVAFRGQIHVFVPQNAPQVLRETPALILQPRPSEAARIVGGYISHDAPHQINHVMVGELGDFEVLVAAYDDGDVVAYYTHSIAAVVDHNARRSKTSIPTSKPPREFFHESVGRSAWGLAVHKKSRLIAVSCNTKEVTVFAFALDPPPDSSGESLATTISMLGPDKSPRLSCGHSAFALESHLRARTRDWRIILTLPYSTPNLPSVAFCEDERGNADRIVAGDTLGYTWILQIWRVGAKAIRVPPTRPELHQCWGVLVLPDHLFKPVETAEEFAGLSSSSVDGYETGTESRAVLDTTYCAALVPQNPTSGEVAINRQGPTHPNASAVKMPAVFPKVPPRGPGNDDGDDDVEGSGSDVGGRLLQPLPPSCLLVSAQDYISWSHVEDAQAASYTPATYMLDFSEASACAIVPGLGLVLPTEGLKKVDFVHNVLLDRKRQQFIKFLTLKEANKSGHLTAATGRRFSVLRTGQTSVELCSVDAQIANVLCRNLLSRFPREKPHEPWDMASSRQIFMVHCIPELSAVVIGSACGRVALLRLTKAENGGRIRNGFRVEWVLPRTEEDSAGLRPNVWLAGIAVSPIPQPGARGSRLFPSPAQPRGAAAGVSSFKDQRRPPVHLQQQQQQQQQQQPGHHDHHRYEKPAPTRWRLIMHFMDHTILTYTIEAENPHPSPPAVARKSATPDPRCSMSPTALW